MKVKVIKASEDIYWYAKHIGEEFEVEEGTDEDSYLVIDSNVGVDYYIDKNDCEVINKTINWRETLINMFPEITTREKKENNEWCPKCDGIGLVRNGNYIEGCTNCFGKGIIKACECGNKIEKNYYTHCKECRDRHEEERRLENYNKANKINYDDYDGLFLWNERVITKEDLEEYLYDIIYNDEEVPTYIPFTYQTTVFSNIDLYDVVNDKCEDGYEDMNSYFDYKSPKFEEAQKLINEWLDENSSVLNVWYEDPKNIVILTDVIERLKIEIENERNKKQNEEKQR